MSVSTTPADLLASLSEKEKEQARLEKTLANKADELSKSEQHLQSLEQRPPKLFGKQAYQDKVQGLREQLPTMRADIDRMRMSVDRLRVEITTTRASLEAALPELATDLDSDIKGAIAAYLASDDDRKLLSDGLTRAFEMTTFAASVGMDVAVLYPMKIKALYLGACYGRQRPNSTDVGARVVHTLKDARANGSAHFCRNEGYDVFFELSLGTCLLFAELFFRSEGFAGNALPEVVGAETDDIRRKLQYVASHDDEPFLQWIGRDAASRLTYLNDIDRHCPYR